MTRGEEQALIRRAVAGDRAAAEGLIRAHQQSLYAYLLRMSGRPELAEDVVQEAFVRALTHLDRFDPRFRFSTWLFTIARRLLMNLAQRRRPTGDTEVVVLMRGRAAAPGDGVEREEVRGNIHDALGAALLELPEEQREVVVLFHQLDWPIRLISQHLRMPEGTVKSHLHRGRRRLRVILESSLRTANRVGEAVA
ncbi:MAG: sigma-70 family RNA polymerase sigma factor [Phycisphaerales bacterium]